MDSNFRSKKFVAFLISEISWKILIGLALFYGRNSIGNDLLFVLTAIIGTAGLTELGYILGQAGLDAYAKMADKILNRNKKDDNDPQISA